MDCAGFERGLARVASGELDGAARDRMLAELRRHAGSCPDCEGAAALVDVLAPPAGERDLVADPGPEYWKGFEGRVRERIDRERRMARRGAARRRMIAAAMAAVAVVAVGAILWGLRETTTPPAVAETGPGAGSRPGVPSESGTAALPQLLEDRLAEVPVNDLLDEVDAVAGWGGDWETGDGHDASGSWSAPGPFPDVSDLDEESRQVLLRWLKEQTDRSRA